MGQKYKQLTLEERCKVFFLHINRTYEDRVSAKDLKRPNLQAMITYVREGDIVALHSTE